MHQTGPRILLSVTRMLYVKQVCHGVGRCVKYVVEFIQLCGHKTK